MESFAFAEEKEQRTLGWILPAFRGKGQGCCGVRGCGLGAGTFDPRHVPPRPHPRCLCGRRHVLREPGEWGAPRGELPALVVSPTEAAQAEGWPPSQVRNMGKVIALGRGGAKRLDVVTLPTVAETARAGRVVSLADARASFAQRQAAARELARSRRKAG